MIELKNKIFVMRHGQSENNILGVESCVYETQSKFGLTQEGQNQVKENARKIDNFDFIYTSPYKRTIESAEIVAQNHNCPIEIIEDLQEFKLPSRLDQRPYEEAEIVIHDPKNDLNNSRVEDSESFREMFERMNKTIFDLNERHENASILIVTHGSLVEAAIQVMKGGCTGFGPFENLPKNAEIIFLNKIKNV